MGSRMEVKFGRYRNGRSSRKHPFIHRLPDYWEGDCAAPIVVNKVEWQRRQ